MQHIIAQPTFLARIQDNPAVALDFLKRYLTEVVNVLNSATQSVGAAIASAGTIAVTNPIHHITGTATISTITVPFGFTGPLFLISDSGYSYDNAGNISVSATVAAGNTGLFVYDGTTWYPT